MGPFGLSHAVGGGQTGLKGCHDTVYHVLRGGGQFWTHNFLAHLLPWKDRSLSGIKLHSIVSGQ